MSTPDPTRPTTATTTEPGPGRRRSPILLIAFLLALALLAWYVFTRRNIDATVDIPPPIAAPAGPPVAPLEDGAQRTERVPDQQDVPRPRDTTPRPAPRIEAVEPTPVLTIEGRNPKPPYPPEALRRQIGGIVVLRVDVDATGAPVNVEFARRSGDRDLDRAAFDAVKTWRFKPATRNGKPVAEVVEVPIEFKPGEP